MATQTPAEYITSLSNDEFRSNFYEMARSEAFSAIASRVDDPSARSQIRVDCIHRRLPPWLFQTDDQLFELVKAVASRAIR